MDADEKSYIMAAATVRVPEDNQVNDCGLPLSQTYSIISAFTMIDEFSKEHNCLLMRDPNGKNSYSWDWSFYDERWTD